MTLQEALKDEYATAKSMSKFCLDQRNQFMIEGDFDKAEQYNKSFGNYCTQMVVLEHVAFNADLVI